MVPYCGELACPAGQWPTAGPTADWKTKPLPTGKNKLAQQAVGPAAGPIVGWRINLVPCCGELAAAACCLLLLVARGCRWLLLPAAGFVLLDP